VDADVGAAVVEAQLDAVGVSGNCLDSIGPVCADEHTGSGCRSKDCRRRRGAAGLLAGRVIVALDWSGFRLGITGTTCAGQIGVLCEQSYSRRGQDRKG